MPYDLVAASSAMMGLDSVAIALTTVDALESEEIGANQFPIRIELEGALLRLFLSHTEIHFCDTRFAFALDRGDDDLVRSFHFHHCLHEEIDRIAVLREIVNRVALGETGLQRLPVMDAERFGKCLHEVEHVFVSRDIEREGNGRSS